MRINRIIILGNFIEKIERQHQINSDEIREVFYNVPYFRKLEKGHIKGEDVYGAYGQTNEGRYISIFFVYKINKDALIISARNMDQKERRRYAKT